MLATLLAPFPALSSALALERIAIVAPVSDRYPILGRQAVRGARLALGLPPDAPIDPAAPPFDGDPALVVIDDPCRGGDNAAEDGALVAQALVEADVDAAVGFLCWSTLEAALGEGTLDGLPIVTGGVRAEALTDRAIREGWSAWRVAPRAGDEARAIARHVVSAWRGQPFAILDDGTIYGRELAERVGVILSGRGAEPVYTETYRPAVSRQFALARRLASSGASRVLIAGERRDAAIIARDAVAAGLELVFLGGDAMRARDDDVPLPPGVRAVVFTPALEGGYEATTRAATEVVLAAAKEAERADISLERALALGPYGTSLGPIAFDLRGDLREEVRAALFEPREWNGRAWVDTGSGEAVATNGDDAAADGVSEETDAARTDDTIPPVETEDAAASDGAGGDGPSPEPGDADAPATGPAESEDSAETDRIETASEPDDAPGPIGDLPLIAPVAPSAGR